MRLYFLLAGAALSAAPALSQTTSTYPAQGAPGQAAPGQTTVPPTGAPTTAMPSTGTAPAATPNGAAAPTGAPATGTALTGNPATDPNAAVITPAVGATVLDPSGVPVGKIKSMDSQYVTLETDKGEARLPVAGVGPGRGGAAVGLSKAQIDAAVVQAKAAEPATTKTTTKTTTTKKR